MLLAADRKLTLEPALGPVDRRGRVAAAEAVILLNACAALERIGDGDGRRLRLDVDFRQPRRPARLIARARDDCEQSLAVEDDLLLDEQGLVGEDRRDVVPARN